MPHTNVVHNIGQLQYFGSPLHTGLHAACGMLRLACLAKMNEIFSIDRSGWLGPGQLGLQILRYFKWLSLIFSHKSCDNVMCNWSLYGRFK